MKPIHFLLIALLCYGQVVANIHVVEHIHVDDDSGSFHQSSVICDAHIHTPADSILPAQPHDCVHRADVEKHSDKNSEKDCAIYHALLSLSGVFSVQRQLLSDPLQVPANATFPVVNLTNPALRGFRIRAPPALS